MALTPHPERRLAAVGFLLCLCAAPGTAMLAAEPATSEDARRAYDAGRFTDAMGIWADLSRQDNASAAFGLGLLYDLGNGVPEDPAHAFIWYKAAAEAGLPAAEFNVGAMYDSGRGVSQSSENAALWYAKAAAHKHARAAFDLSQLYEQGDGVPRNLGAAAAWLRVAASGRLEAAAERLKALEAARPNRPTPSRPIGSLTGVTLASPARDATLALAPSAGRLTVELVWVAASEPRPVQYEVQVQDLGAPVQRTVLNSTIAETALLLPLPATPGFYVWKVDAISSDGARASSDWSWFSIGSATRPQQSMASTNPASPSDQAKEPPR